MLYLKYIDTIFGTRTLSIINVSETFQADIKNFQKHFKLSNVERFRNVYLKYHMEIHNEKKKLHVKRLRNVCETFQVCPVETYLKSFRNIKHVGLKRFINISEHKIQ